MAEYPNNGYGESRCPNCGQDVEMCESCEYEVNGTMFFECPTCHFKENYDSGEFDNPNPKGGD